MIIAVPTGMKIFNWLATLWRGNLHFDAPMLYALGFLSIFTMGGLTGIFLAAFPVDWQLHDSYFVVAHFHYTIFGGVVFGLLAGLHYWWPKMFGRLLDERLGKASFWLMFVGFHLTFLPQHFLGLLGMPRRIYTYGPELGLGMLNLMSTVGAFLTGLSLLVFVYNAWSSRREPRVGKNPWAAATLEWAVSSPPPVYNFSVLPTVTSRLPLWTEHGVSEIPDTPPGPIHVPGGSHWPLMTALGILVIAVGALLHHHFVPSLVTVLAGLGVVVVSVYRWAFEPFEV
jgi:cytochrome c oxidase subunit 1